MYISHRPAERAGCRDQGCSAHTDYEVTRAVIHHGDSGESVFILDYDDPRSDQELEAAFYDWLVRVHDYEQDRATAK